MPAKAAPSSPSALLAVLVFLVTVAVFWPARQFDFVDVDDGVFVTDNPHVQRGLTADGVVWAFTEFHASNWVPVTFLSLMIDRSLFGPDPWGFHLTNLLLHALDAALLLLLVHRLTGRRWAALAVALLFALHPMRVESVAWVSERKDVLSTAFWWMTTLAWLAWLRHRRRRDWLGAHLLYAVGLATKGMLVTLPVTLLILDWWPMRRREPWRARIVEKLGLFSLAAAAALVTLRAQAGGSSVTGLEALGPGARLANALVGAATYPVRLLWPVDLAWFYPHPAFVPPYQGWPAQTVALSVALLAGLTVAGVALARRGERAWMAGWLWYLVTLLPVAGLVQVGMQATADRYSYVPHVGLLLGVVFTARALVERRPRLAPAAVGLAALVVIAGAALTRRELPHWHDSEALFGRALEVTQDNGVAMAALGAHRARTGRMDEALPLLEEAVRVQPGYAEAHADLGIVLAAQGEDDRAATELEDALAVLPGHARARVALANVRARQGRPSDAARQYRLALESDPNLWEAHFGLAQIARLRGQPDEARRQLERALELTDDPTARQLIRRALD